MKNAVIYCRVSTEDQVKNLSLTTQEEFCRRHCERADFAVREIFVDRGASAKTANRPSFQAMLVYCRRHARSIDFVVVYRLDRFARNVYDHVDVIGQLGEWGILLRSVTERIDETPTGKFMATMVAAVSQLDNDVRRERTIDGMRAALKRGRWTFPPPLGYLPGNRSRGEASLIFDPERADLVRRGFELMAKGAQSQAAVLETLTALGLRTKRGKLLRPQEFAKSLRKPVYGGRVVCEKLGVDEQGDFEPLVDQKTYQQVQRRLDGGRPRMRDNPDFPLRRFVRCERCEQPAYCRMVTGAQRELRLLPMPEVQPSRR